MSVEASITRHYAASDLLSAIEAGMAALGKSPETVGIDDLGPVDEFHIGGRAATTELCERVGIVAEAEVLDVGSGIGGTARHVASTFGCQVAGLDLTPDYVEVARTLTEWTDLTDQVRFEVGNALDMPFEDGSFDAATLIHVGMNIEDKAALFEEVARVLRPGARLGLYDIMSTAEAEVAFPVPWAPDASVSFLAPLAAYRDMLESAGFEVEELRDRRDFALEFFGAMKQRMAEQGPPPLGLHVIIGSETPQKIANMVEAIGAGVVAPVEVICRRR